MHSTVRGPAAGGCRSWHYPNRAAMAEYALRLAEGMTYKNALADLPLGGKSVLRLPGGAFDRKRLFEAFGRAVADARRSYVTARYVGTTGQDMLVVSGRTRYVAGLPRRCDAPGGDPSPWTARGVLSAMEVAVARRLNRPLRKRAVAIQGVGQVGLALARMLHREGARVIVADVNHRSVARAVAEAGATAMGVEDILSWDADVLAPCALGSGLSHRTVGAVRASVVCGAANNQLDEPEDGVRLADRGVLYAPGYVVNAGGMINVAAEHLCWPASDARRRVEATGDRLAEVLRVADIQRVSTNLAAEVLARSMVHSSASPMFQAA